MGERGIASVRVLGGEKRGKNSKKDSEGSSKERIKNVIKCERKKVGAVNTKLVNRDDDGGGGSH